MAGAGSARLGLDATMLRTSTAPLSAAPGAAGGGGPSSARRARLRRRRQRARLGSALLRRGSLGGADGMELGAGEQQVAGGGGALRLGRVHQDFRGQHEL